MEDKLTFKNSKNKYIKEIDIINDIVDPIKRIKDKKRMLLLDIYKMYKICLYEHYNFMVRGINNNLNEEIKYKNNNGELYIEISYINNKYNISYPFFKNKNINSYIKNKKLKIHKYEYISIKYNYKSRKQDNISNFMFLYNFEDILKEMERMKLLFFLKVYQKQKKQI